MDLHPFIDPARASIGFRLVRQGRFVCVDVPGKAISETFGVPEGPHGLLEACALHRERIDAAVLRRAGDCSAAVALVHACDLGGGR